MLFHNWSKSAILLTGKGYYLLPGALSKPLLHFENQSLLTFIDLFQRFGNRKPSGPVDLRECLQLTRSRRPFYFEGIADNCSRIDVLFQRPRTDRFPGFELHRGQRYKIPFGRNTRFFPEFADSGSQRIFVVRKLPLRDGPRPRILVLPERSARMRQEKLQLRGGLVKEYASGLFHQLKIGKSSPLIIGYFLSLSKKDPMRNCLLLALLFCCQLVLAQDPPEKYARIWEKINTNPGSSSVQKELKKLRQDNPSDPWIYWISGLTCNPVNGQEEAAAFYRQAIAADSTFPHAYYNLAMTIEADNERAYREVIALQTKAVTYDPTLGFAFLGRGEAYAALGEYDAALADCEQARNCPDFDPLQADAFQLEILWKQHKKQEAFELVRKVNFNDGMMMWGTDFDLLLAAIYEEMGDQKSACTCYHNAAEPFEMMGEEIPVEIKNGLKKCK
jgi:tetratricopeptide (TPR) repeat protein